MRELRFDWDAVKNAANHRKHGVWFEEAKSVFTDDNARLISDPDHSLDEDRFILLGISQKARLLVVCHVYREDDGLARIISARKATKREQDQYSRAKP